MEDTRLHISQAEYLPSHECYVVTDAILQRLNLNNIKAKELSESGEKGEEKQEKAKKPLKYIYPEEILYLTYVVQHQSNQAIGLDVNKQNWEELKQKDIMTIYANLSEEGFNKWQFIQFYIKIRKKSKIIERFSLQNIFTQTSNIPIYRIFRNVKDYREKKNDQIHYLTTKNEKISNILQNLKTISAQSSIKIHIIFNLDGIILLSKPSFKIGVKTLE